MTDRFIRDITRNRNIALILDRWERLNLPDCWLVAGCLFQTVWNLKSNHRPDAYIKDYDLFYFNPDDRSAEMQEWVQHRTAAVFKDLDITIEAVNQARVHLWCEEHFGYPYPQLQNSRDGIDRFLILETCLGIRPGEIYAPNGLSAMYEGRLTMNPATPFVELYRRKVESYQQRWPWLTPLSLEG